MYGNWLRCTAIFGCCFAAAAHADVILLNSGQNGDAQADQSAATLADPKLSQDVLQRAREALGRGDLENCRKLLRESVQENADTADPEILLASLLFDAGQTGPAMQVLNAFAMTPEAAFEAHFAFAKLAAGQGRWFDAWAHAQASQRAERPARWSEDFERQSGHALDKLTASIALARGDFSDAIARYEQLASELADDADVQSGLGLAYFRDNQLKQATTCFQRAAELQPGGPPYELQLANLFAGAGQHDQAESWYQQAVRSSDDEQMPPCRLAYANWLINRNQPEAAIKLLNAVEFPEAQQMEKMVGLGLAARMSGDFSTAEAIFSKLHQQTPGNPLMSNQLALVLIESEDEGKRARAMQIAKSNVQRAQNPTTIGTYGWIQYRLGEPEQAEQTLQRLMQAQVDRDTVYFMAQVKRALGKVQEADRLQNFVLNAAGPFYYDRTPESANP